MTLDEFREYCNSFKAVTEEFPFDEVVVTYKVGAKIFALTDINTFEHISVKCDPENALAYREAFKGVTPGYHMNKRHWNSLVIGSDVSDEQIKAWIGESYDLVVSNLPKKDRAILECKGLGKE